MDTKITCKLTCRAGGDVELRQTQSKTDVANLSVATNEYQGRNEDGSEKERLEQWHKIVGWGKVAVNESCFGMAGVRKGDVLQIEAKPRYRDYEGNGTAVIDGETYEATVTRNTVEYHVDPRSFFNLSQFAREEAARSAKPDTGAPAAKKGKKPPAKAIAKAA